MKKNSFGFAAAFVTLALLGGATSSVGCGGVSTSSLCADLCACNRCTSNDLQTCEDEADKASSVADSAGCSSQFDDFVSCAGAHVTCEKDRAVIKGCDAEESALAKCDSGVDPLQKSDCERASAQLVARLDVCGVKVNTGGPGGTPVECTDAAGALALCSAACFDLASCDFLKCGLGGDMTACSNVQAEDTKAFSDCSAKCK